MVEGAAEDPGGKHGRYTIDVRGPLRLTRDGTPIVLRPKERAALAALAFDHPRPVRWDRVAELVWAEVPRSARGSLHNHISRLREQAPDLVLTVDDGYRLADTTHIETLPTYGDAPGTPGPTPFAELVAGDEVLARRARIGVRGRHAGQREAERLVQAGDLEAAATLALRIIDEEPYDERAWAVLAESRARAGERRAALATLARVRRHFVEVGLEPGPHLRDLEAAIHDGTFGAARTPPAARTNRPAVGLDRPVAHLLDILDHDWGTALVRGPAGAGKTTLLTTFAERARRTGWRVLWAGCHRDPVVPLQPVADLAERVLASQPLTSGDLGDAAALGALSPAIADRVGRPSGPVDRHRLLAALGDLCRTLPERTVLVVEDVHWAPPRTMEALRAMATAVTSSERSTVLVCSERRDPGDDHTGPGDQVVDLQPWSSADIVTWLSHTDPDPARTEAAAAWLLHQTGGSPLFVRELAVDLERQGLIGNSSASAFEPPRGVPTAISNALALRVDRLSAGARRALEAAAVLTGPIDPDVLGRMIGGDLAAVDELLRRSMLLVEPGSRTFTFEHDLLHRTVLDGLSSAATAELHDVALLALGPDVSDLERAHHAVGAAALDRHRAVEAAVAGGSDALARSARADAAEWWLAAADLLDADGIDVSRSCELRIDAGEQLLHAGDLRAAAILFDAAERAERSDLLEVAARAAAIVSRLGPTSQAGSAHGSAAVLCDRLLDRLEDPAARATLAAASTMVHSLSGHAQRCRALFDTAVADARTVERDEVWADVLPFAYQSLGAPDDLDRREAFTDRLAAVGGRLHRPDTVWSALHLRFSNQVQRGDAAARATAAALERLAPEVRELSRDWEMHYVRATVLQLDGDLDACEREITASLRYADTIAASRVQAVFGVQLLSLRAQQGRLAELVDAIAALAADQPGVGAWRAALAMAAAQAGRRDEAIASFDAALADSAALLDRDQTYSAALLALGEAAVALADGDRAARIARLLVPYCDRWSWAGSCTLGPIATTLAGLAALTVTAGDGNEHALAAEHSAHRLGAPRFADAARRRAGEGHRRAAG